MSQILYVSCWIHVSAAHWCICATIRWTHAVLISLKKKKIDDYFGKVPHVWKSKKASLCSLVSKFRREQLVRSRTQQQEEASPKSRWRVSIFPLWSTTFDSLTVTSFLTLWSMRWVLQVAFGKSRVMLWYKEFYIYVWTSTVVIYLWQKSGQAQVLFRNVIL